MIRAISLFLLAAFFEVSGVYLVWQWIRAGRPAYFGLAGLAALLLYGLTQTRQAFDFGRSFAAYGAVFILAALVWSWLADRQLPDRWDWIGAAICLAGAGLILWGPRR